LRIPLVDMSTLSATRIARYFSRSDAAKTKRKRGRLLERLVAYLFGRCAGVRHYRNNALNAAGSSEIDVCFWNNRALGSLDFLPQILVIECKNTNKRIGSSSVRSFLAKLHQMGLDHGILIAASGVTGNAKRMRAAHDVIRSAFQTDRTRLIVLTRAELEGLSDTDDLIRLLQDKVMLLTMQAQTFRA
jgi:hypothetical protein